MTLLIWVLVFIAGFFTLAVIQTSRRNAVRLAQSEMYRQLESISLDEGRVSREIELLKRLWALPAAEEAKHDR